MKKSSDKPSKPNWTDLVAPLIDHDLLPYLDRSAISEVGLNHYQLQWRHEGVAIIPKAIDDLTLSNYCELRATVPSRNGWASDVPYMKHNQIKDICLHHAIMQVMEDLIGDRMGLHLNLTGYVSTERNWHQDYYLNPPQIGSWYAAAWIALDDIHPDSGPFQYVPGSHTWGVMTQQKVLRYLTQEEKESKAWPKLTERFVTEACESEIKKKMQSFKPTYPIKEMSLYGTPAYFTEALHLKTYP